VPSQGRGDTPQAILLLEHGANINARDEHGRTPLYGTLEGDPGHLALVPLLLANGADTNSEDEGRMTLLRMALEEGHLRVVRGLLDLGANVHVRNNRGLTVATWMDQDCESTVRRREYSALVSSSL